MQSAAFIYAVLCAGVILFQICLIAGAPWGHLTQGGGHTGVLPLRGRVIAAISILLLMMMAGAVLSGAGGWPNWPRWAAWGALGVQAVSMLLNWITPSGAERRLWGPVTTVMFALALGVMVA
ncbi:MAG: hypothetical protein R3E82_18640 [Pseudomonadales bacterium]|nr:hypothetical protein [Pseudomonadales bacterium]